VARIEGGIILLNLAVFAVSILLMLTIGGSAFIPPVMIPVYMWTRGALMGQWIWKTRYEEQTRLNSVQSGRQTMLEARGP
jgi:hypothetical protein